MAWKSLLEQGKELVLATSSGGKPNAVVVISQGFVGDRLLINACQMVSTLENIRKNPQVAVVAMGDGEYYRIRGQAEVAADREVMRLAKERNEGPEVKCAILIHIVEVFDLDSQKVIL